MSDKNPPFPHWPLNRSGNECPPTTSSHQGNKERNHHQSKIDSRHASSLTDLKGRNRDHGYRNTCTASSHKADSYDNKYNKRTYTPDRRIILALTVCLIILCVAIKSTKLDSQLSSWIQRTERIDAELQYVNLALNGQGVGSEATTIGTTSQLLLQTPRSTKPDANVLTVDSLMIHLEAMAIATHVTVDIFDVTWSLKDLCYTPTLPDYEGISAEMLEKMIPCAIKTPLDCFWEGAKLLGPHQPITLGHFMGPIPKWTSLNPLIMVEAMQRGLKNSDFPFQSLVAWMRRVGINTGYQYKPCLDPTDPNCPSTAPNKFTGEPPNIGAQLTGGCKALAENQWHWKEEEIVGEFVKNKSGYIIKATALQSTIQLMGDQDMYDYWRRTNKVVDINNWSADKAKLILDSWQSRFKEELAQFTRTSSSSKSYKIHAMTSKLMQEPIDQFSLLDLTTFELCLLLMTIFTCFSFPNFTRKCSQEVNRKQDIEFETVEIGNETSISRMKTMLLALIASSFVLLTFIASLGLSSFMDLPFNMATTQILPPLALYYGFNQLNMIANIYSQRFKITPNLDDLTTDSLNELFPIVRIESLTYISALLVAAIIPVEATRVFAFQAISYIVVASLTAILLIPSIFTYFLIYHKPYICDQTQTIQDTCSFHHQDRPKSRTCRSPTNKFLVRKSVKQTQSDNSDLEAQIIARFHDDLKNIKATTRHPADINLSAQFEMGGKDTNFHSPISISQGNNGSRPSCTSSDTLDRELYSAVHKPGHENTSLKPDFTSLPDLLADALPPTIRAQDIASDIFDCKLLESSEKIQENPNQQTAVNVVKRKSSLFDIYIKNFTTKRYVQVQICLLISLSIVISTILAPNVKYGLFLRDIVARGTSEYEPLSIQEKFFPVYNTFAVTKGNFDYPTNQKLLHEFHKSIEQVDGIVKDGNVDRFWLVCFRSWLLELQQEFDVEYSKYNKSASIGDDWTSELSDTSKLAYKLLAQTGKIDNPVDRNIVETNRLVDSNGIINPKAFYYYLTAWVIKDPFTYAFSEANFKPEPKIWDDNPNNLKIEKARPLTYTQIPFLMKLPANHDNLKTISEIRSISQAFEQLNLPNFPTGIPFIFWDQFLNLDLLFLVAITIAIISAFIIIELTTLDLRIAAIMTVPIMLTSIELYSFMGYAAIPFNNILAVLLISAIGIAILPTIHHTTYFFSKDGDVVNRTQETLRHRLRIISNSLGLLLICALTFQFSKFEFINKYSYLLMGLAILNSLNSLFWTPILLCVFGTEFKSPQKESKISTEKSSKEVNTKQFISKTKHRTHKKRSYPKLQSEISLSTISEEPQLNQSEANDLKIVIDHRVY